MLQVALILICFGCIFALIAIAAFWREREKPAVVACVAAVILVACGGVLTEKWVELQNKSVDNLPEHIRVLLDKHETLDER